MGTIININDDESRFNFLKMPSSQWGDYFISVPIANSDFDVLTKEIEVLKPKVREDILMLSSGNNELMKKKIHLIHLLESLGLSFYFTKEIEETLKNAFEKIEYLIDNENNLYTISIMFRVFRAYGHNMSSDVFKRFKGKDGKFKQHVTEDVKGMLSLYEAVALGTRKDHILDEASSFTFNHLEPLTTSQKASAPHIIKLIKMAFHIPQHRNNQALVAREYISFYEQEEDHDETLLNLAKLNFKLLQLHYFQELKTITKWWRELDHASSLPPNFRERTVETWFSALLMYFEPQFSLGRVMSAKLYLSITYLDDACDTYGSISEVASLADCLERWDPAYMNNLEGHMKTAFEFVMYVYNEYELIMTSQHRSFVIKWMIEEYKILVRTNYNLVKWARGGHVPSFDEYIEVGGAEIATYLTIACSIMGLGESGSNEAFEWLMSRPKIVTVLGAKTRIMDDIADFDEDMNKGYTANALNYYMKEHGIAKEEAIVELEKLIVDMNKIVNEESMKITNIHRRIIMQCTNFRRSLDVLYTADDVYNNRDGMLKDYMNLMFVEPL
ncbi:unnamed protein product [Cochlearia groenlandica]